MEWGTLFWIADVNILLIKYHAVRTASPQNFKGILALIRKVRVVSIICRCLGSTMPFCCGVWGQDN